MRDRFAAALCVVVALQGCSTYQVDAISYVYRWVQFGTCLLGKIWSVDVGEQPDTATKVLVGVLMLPFIAFFAVDLPLSFEADTVLLPVTIPVQAKFGDRCR